MSYAIWSGRDVTARPVHRLLRPVASARGVTELRGRALLLALGLAACCCGARDPALSTAPGGGLDAASDVAIAPDAAAGLDAGPDAAWDTGPAPDVAADADAATPVCPADDGSPPPQQASLSELQAATVDLHAGWRFALDPKSQGEASGWHLPGFDDEKWGLLDAGKPWESQGFEGYDGTAWYRKKVSIPAPWKGSAVRIFASGIDDEYDVWVNGKHAGHFGSPPATSVWNWQTITRVDELLTFGADNLIVVRVVDWGGNGGIWRAITLRRSVPLGPYKGFLPAPVLPAKPAWVALYWEAWRMAWDKVSFGTPNNGLAAAYMDEGFNEQIYQWDSSFITLFARHGRRLMPVMATLDNFYARQRKDGYIQRVYSETDGKQIAEPTADEPMVNPPLFAWVELSWYRTTGDKARVAKVLPVLEKYFAWLKANLRAPPGKGLYYQTHLGSGMDNTPRGDVYKAAWIDMSAQQALAARCLARLAEALGDLPRRDVWLAEHATIRKGINGLLWDEEAGMYFDLRANGQLDGVWHIGAFWTLLADVAGTARAAKLVAHLQDPKRFKRPHRYPTLAASDPHYDGAGHYWRGGVWAPTNEMVVAGLLRAGRDDLAREVAAEHIETMAAVYASPPKEAQIAPEERDGEYATIWECYAPESAAPGTRWDKKWLSRQDFVGWSGLGPIGMLLEVVLGFDVDGAAGRVTWTAARTDRHGVENLLVGEDNPVSLVADPRAAPGEPLHVTAAARRPFELEVLRPGRKPVAVKVCAGSSTFQVP